MTKTKGQKRNPSATPAGGGLVFVVDVSSLTEEGFLGSSTYEGEKVDIEFDDLGKGVFLTREMAKRLRVRKGSDVLLTIEDDSTQVASLTISGVGKTIRISDSKVYYELGREGGGVVRLRRP